MGDVRCWLSGSHRWQTTSCIAVSWVSASGRFVDVLHRCFFQIRWRPARTWTRTARVRKVAARRIRMAPLFQWLSPTRPIPLAPRLIVQVGNICRPGCITKCNVGVCLYEYVCGCLCVSVLVCMKVYVCMYAWVCKYMCIVIIITIISSWCCMYECLCMHAYMCVLVCMGLYVWVSVYVCMYNHHHQLMMFVCVCMSMFAFTCVHVRMGLYVWVCMYVCIIIIIISSWCHPFGGDGYVQITFVVLGCLLSPLLPKWCYLLIYIVYPA